MLHSKEPHWLQHSVANQSGRVNNEREPSLFPVDHAIVLEVLVCDMRGRVRSDIR